MAAVSDCFSIGSIVACTTCFMKNIEGEVLAFDSQTKMLILSILLQNHKIAELHSLVWNGQRRIGSMCVCRLYFYNFHKPNNWLLL